MITVTKLSDRTALIYIGKQLRQMFKSGFAVVSIVHGSLIIREALLADINRHKISVVNQIAFTHDCATEFIGQWDYEVQGDEIRLIETE